MVFIEEYKEHVHERMLKGLPPLPLTREKIIEVINLIKANNSESTLLVSLLENRVNPGVDDAAFVKAAFLDDVVKEKCEVGSISKQSAIKMLGQMLGGYNVQPLINALKAKDVAQDAANALKDIILIYNAFNNVVELSKENAYAKEIIESWANAEWFFNRPELPGELTVTVFKVSGETNTDDLSPGYQAFTRDDIPLHSLSMLSVKMPEALELIRDLKKKGHPVAYVGDVVGTGSSRKSGVNSIQWHFGKDIVGVPNKRTGAVVLAGKIAPIFFATCEDSGVFPIDQIDVTKMESGDVITINLEEGKILKDGNLISEFKTYPDTIKDEFRAGGRLPLIIGKKLTRGARKTLGMEEENVFIKPTQPECTSKVYTLAQKIIGKACGMEGVTPGMYVEPETQSVGTQDTTGAMTRDEIKALAALSFSADLVLQTLCHTAAYPKKSEIFLQQTLPPFIINRGGVSIKVGDGIIHNWMNRMILPDSVGTGGDSHTRFPMGISFPAGSGLVAFGAITGHIPLIVPESVLVRFKGKLQRGITLRDIVNAIPYYAIKQGHLTIPKENKVNVFNGRVLEIEGFPEIKVEQAYEFSDSSAERSAAGCTVRLNKEPVIEFIKSNVILIEAMIRAGYKDARVLERRANRMKEWLKKPILLEPDAGASYAAIIEIDISEIKEPILACPNDPDNMATLSEVLADKNKPHKIEEVFVGSCMTNIGHYRALSEILRDEGHTNARLWVAPPTKMDERELVDNGYYSIIGAAGARTEIPGCSLCMGNQARVKDGAVVFSTSTRNFDNRMGNNTQTYLGSAELAAVCALLGRIPTVEEYMKLVPDKLDGKRAKVYKFFNFNEIENYELDERVGS